MLSGSTLRTNFAFTVRRPVLTMLLPPANAIERRHSTVPYSKTAQEIDEEEEQQMLEEQMEMMRKESEFRKKFSAEEEQLRLMRLQQLEFIKKQKHADLLRRPQTAPVHRSDHDQPPPRAQGSSASVRAEFAGSTDARSSSASSSSRPGRASMPLLRPSSASSPRKPEAAPQQARTGGVTVKQMLASNRVAAEEAEEAAAAAALRLGEHMHVHLAAQPERRSSCSGASPKKLAWGSFKGSAAAHFETDAVEPMSRSDDEEAHEEADEGTYEETTHWQGALGGARSGEREAVCSAC